VETTQPDVSLQQPGSRAKPRRSRSLSATLRLAVFPRHAVGLDISGDVVAAAEVRRHGRDFKVLRSGSAPLHPTQQDAPDADRKAALVDAIRRALRNARINTRKVVVNLPGDPTETIVRTFPAMPVNELEAVVRREGVELFGAAATWDCIVLQEKAGEEQRVVAAFAPGDRVAECLQVLKECGLAAASVCVPHLALLQIMNRTAESDTSTALIHFRTHAASITILTGGSPALMRRIQLDAATVGSPEYLVHEINRTFVYFKQQSRGKRISKVIQCGAGDAVTRLLGQTLGVPVEDFGSELLGTRKAEAAATSPARDASSDAEIAVAAGLAVTGTVGAEIDLLPDDVKDRRKKGFQIATLLMGAVSVLTIYAACYMALDLAEEIYGQAVEKQRAESVSFAPIHELYQEIQRIKEKLNQKQELQAALLKESVPCPHLLWGISRVLPPEAVLTRVSAARERDGETLKWKVKISGSMSAAGEQRMRALRQLLANMQNSGIFQAVQLDPLSEEGAGKTLGFSIQCEVVPTEQWAS